MAMRAPRCVASDETRIRFTAFPIAVRELEMTVSFERTRAVLLAGGLLVQINDDARIPLDIRMAAHSIARHFPTVNEVASMALSSMPTIGGGMFERPEDVQGWQDGCPAGPLRDSTRLRCPKDQDDEDSEAAEASLEEAVGQLHAARVIYEENIHAVYLQLVSRYSELRAVLESRGSDDTGVAAWLCAPTFDNNTKSPADLFVAGRGQEVLDRIVQSDAGVYR